MSRCDLSKGNIAITDNSLTTCNGTSISMPISLLQIVGSTTSHSVSITNSILQIELAAVSIRSGTAFAVSSGTVSLFLTGPSTILAVPVNCGVAVIQCHETSNLTFAGLRDGSLTAQGAVQGTGIGSGQNHGCTSLRFVNGTFRATSGQSGGT
jgi:hypothetical protein